MTEPITQEELDAWKREFWPKSNSNIIPRLIAEVERLRKELEETCWLREAEKTLDTKIEETECPFCGSQTLKVITPVRLKINTDEKAQA